LHQAGLDWITAAKAVSVAIVPLFCLVFYLIFSRLARPSFGFFVVLLILSSYGFVNGLINNVPAACVLMLWALSVFLFTRGKYPVAALPAALCFYVHPFLGYPVWAILLAWGLWTRKTRGLWYLLSLVLAAPFIAHQARYLPYVSFLPVGENSLVELKIGEILLAAAGMVWAVRRRERCPVLLLFWLVLVASVALMFFSGYRYRFLVTQGFLPVLLFAAYALDVFLEHCPERRKQWLILGAAFVFFFLASPTLVVSGGRPKFIAGDSFFINSLKF